MDDEVRKAIEDKDVDRLREILNSTQDVATRNIILREMLTADKKEFKKLMKSVDLKEFNILLTRIQDKMDQAYRIKSSITKKRSDAVGMLMGNLADQNAIKDLQFCYRNEMRLQKVMKKGIKHTIKILERMVRTEGKLKSGLTIQKVTRGTLQVFQYLQRKEGLVEKRLKIEEKLVVAETGGFIRHLFTSNGESKTVMKGHLVIKLREVMADENKAMKKVQALAKGELPKWEEWLIALQNALADTKNQRRLITATAVVSGVFLTTCVACQGTTYMPEMFQNVSEMLTGSTDIWLIAGILKKSVAIAKTAVNIAGLAAL